MRAIAVSLIVAAALAGLAFSSSKAAAQTPFAGLLPGGQSQAWLESGPRAEAWVSRRNNEALRAFYADPTYAPTRDAALAAYAASPAPTWLELSFGEAFALIRESGRPQGAWSRAPVRALRTGAVRWEPLIDLDALSAREGAAMGFAGAICAPRGLRCMVRLTRDGVALSAREFDLERRAFVENGLAVPAEASAIAWLDEDALAFATAQSVRRLRRGASDAPELLRASAPAGSLALRTLRDIDGARFVIAIEAGAGGAAALTLLGPEGATPLALPPGARLLAAHKGEAVFQDAAGGLGSIPLGGVAGAASVRTVYRGGAPLSVFAARDALIAQTREGAFLRLSFDGRAWFEAAMPVRAPLRLDLLAADAEENEALFAEPRLATPPAWRWLDVRSQTLAPARAAGELYPTQALAAAGPDGGEARYLFAAGRGASGAGPVALEIGRPLEDAARAGLWLDRGVGVAFVESADSQTILRIARDLRARGLAARIALIAEGASANAAADAAIADPGLFAAMALSDPIAAAPAFPRGAPLPPTLVFGDRRHPQTASARRLAERAIAAGHAWRYVETAEGGAAFSRDASDLARARRAALTALHVRPRL